MSNDIGERDPLRWRYKPATRAAVQARAFAIGRAVIAPANTSIVTETRGGQGGATPRTRYCLGLRRQHDLTMQFIMALDGSTIRHIEAAFRSSERSSVNLPQFVDLLLRIAPQSVAECDRFEVICSEFVVLRNSDHSISGAIITTNDVLILDRPTPARNTFIF